MPKGFEFDRQEVLLGMYGYFITSEEGAWISAGDLKQGAALLLSSSYISLLLENLRGERLLASLTDEDVDLYSMTKRGILAAEEQLAGRGISLDDFETSFRRRLNFGMIVDARHPELDIARAALDELSVHLRQDNDVGKLSADDLEVAKSEVDELKNSLSKEKIRTHYLWNKANEVLIWIIEKGVGSMVGELAKKALSHIHTFVNIFFN